MVLLKVTGITATGERQEDGTWEFGEFGAGPDTSLRVDDQFWSMFTDFAVTPGSTFASITGPLYYSFGDFKIAPRSAADIAGFVAGETDEATDEAPDATDL
jgi:hypothetical protein